MNFVRYLQESADALGMSLDSSETDGRAAFWQVRTAQCQIAKRGHWVTQSGHWVIQGAGSALTGPFR